MAKKYVSIINNGTKDLYIKDADAQERIAELQAATAPVTYNGQTYTLQQMMTQMAKLMEEVVVVQTPQS